MSAELPEKTENHFHELIDNHFKNCENIDELKKALDSSEGFQNIQRAVSESCDSGCFYDLNLDVAKSSRLDVGHENITNKDMAEKFHLSEPIFSLESDGDQQCSLHIAYEDYQEIINLKEISSQKSLKESIYVHFIAARVMGFHVKIDLNIPQQENTINAKQLVNILLVDRCTTAMKDINLSEILFSVSGKLPLDLKRDSEIMDSDNLHYLQSLCQENYYPPLTERFLLRIEIASINLRYYFYPLFEKLASLDDLDSSSVSPPHKWIIDFIQREVLQKVIHASELIKNGQDYLEITEFLQNIYQSILLNKVTVQSLMKSLDQAVDAAIAELKSFNHHCKEEEEAIYEKDFVLKLRYKCSISLIKPQNKLKGILVDYFHSNGNSKFNQKYLVKKFSQSLRENCAKSKSKMTERDMMRKKWEIALNKNVKIECDAFASNSVLSENQFEVKLCKNGIPIDYEIPVLDPPLNIRKNETREHSITIEWTMPLEEDNHCVRCYRIDYRRVEETSSSRWHSIFTENQKTISTVDDLQSGSVYVFRVQAQFEDFVGVWSEESDRMSTAPCSKSAENAKLLETIKTMEAEGQTLKENLSSEMKKSEKKMDEKNAKLLETIKTMESEEQTLKEKLSAEIKKSEMLSVEKDKFCNVLKTKITDYDKLNEQWTIEKQTLEKLTMENDKISEELKKKIADYEKLKEQMDELKESQKKEAKKAPEYSYSLGLTSLIGLTQNELACAGPVPILNEFGECDFKLSPHSRDDWKKIVTGSSRLYSGAILLPDEIHGLLVFVNFFSRPNTPDTFKIRLDAPSCTANKKKLLPLSLNLQIKIALLKGGHYTSENKRLTFNKIGSQFWAEPKDFVGSSRGADTNKLPDIILKFSK